MKYEEAIEWLKGNRSTWNDHVSEQLNIGRSQAMTNVAVSDAASTQEAYWIVKAHKEGLLEENDAATA